MSGVAKGIGKVFRAVGKIVKKVAVPLLAVAAVVFTGGAALGLGPLAAAGGWGGAVASGLGAIGAPTTGAIGSILTGAVTQAGYGAAIGGAIGAATGQGFEKGAMAGALGGALTGGIGGALTAGAPASAATMSARNLPTGGFTPSPSPGFMPSAGGIAGAAPTTLGAVAPAAAAPAVARGGLSQFLSSPVVGQTISGLGTGLMNGMAAKEQAEADDDLQRKLSGNYDVGRQEYAGDVDTSGRLTPDQKYGRPRYKFNRQSGEIEVV